jgi:hypothetical protein
MNRGRLYPGHNQWNKKQRQRGGKTNDDKFIEPALPPKPPPPFLEEHHARLLTEILGRVVHQSPHIMNQPIRSMFWCLNRLDAKLLPS